MMRKIAGYLTKNRSEKDQKIAQSTHENEYIKPRKTFWRNSKQLLISGKTRGFFIQTQRRRSAELIFERAKSAEGVFGSVFFALSKLFFCVFASLRSIF